MRSKYQISLVLLAFLFGVGEAMAGKYPSHWWKPVPKSEAHWWEILPQEAEKGEVILSKRNELGILSNFAATPFSFHKKRYASVEGFWQMMKFPEDKKDPRSQFPGLVWEHDREKVAQMIAFEAKKAGDVASKNMEKMGINWVTFENKRMIYRTTEKGDHYQLIVQAMREKLKQNAEVKSILLKTGNLKLRPDHHQQADPPPAWRYHEIWMEIRSELQKKAKKK